MTSTPVSLNDESLNGSWIDINCASQIHSPMDNDSPEYSRPPHALAESVQNLGIISFQVERFLQEAQKQADKYEGNSNNEGGQNQAVDNISDMYLSDSDISNDDAQGGKSLIENLRKYNKQKKNYSGNNNDSFLDQMSPELIGEHLSKNGECLLDQVSDSLSILSRGSLMTENCHQYRYDLDNQAGQDFDWLWDWTAQPEYFSGQEWRVCGSKQQEFIMKRPRSFCSSMSGGHRHRHNGRYSSGEIMSLLVLTNILSIIIGAGLTYSILMRKPTV